MRISLIPEDELILDDETTPSLSLPVAVDVSVVDARINEESGFVEVLMLEEVVLLMFSDDDRGANLVDEKTTILRAIITTRFASPIVLFKTGRPLISML